MPRPVSNPPNPWESTSVEWLEEPPPARLEVLEEDARSVVTENASPDVPFRFGLNPYRGCQHACAYCYARPTHQYLSLGAGTDFERKIVVKRNAPELLARELARPRLAGQPLALSGNTDCYQPLEASYELTRRCLEVLLARGNPVAVITKAALVQRDAELLARIHARAGAKVFVSIPFADDGLARAIEPSVSAPSRRFETIRALAAHGIPVGVSFSPLVPGLNEDQLPAVLHRAREAGATSAFLTLLRLPAETASVFRERVREALPLRAERIFSAIRDMRAGRENDPRFGARMRGTGARWKAVARLFELHCRRLGLEHRGGEPRTWEMPSRTPAGPQGRGPRQGTLFG